MNRRTILILMILGAALAGIAAGRLCFLPMLKFFFPTLIARWGAVPSEEMADAAWRFSLVLGLFWAAIPFSALVTERFAGHARYMQALVKSILFGLLVFGIAMLYQRERLASLDRLAAKVPGVFGPSGTPVRLEANPPTSIVWFGAVCQLLFGPVDLEIARLQRKWRKRGGGLDGRCP